MSRTRKHTDIFFLRFLNRIIKEMGCQFTKARTVRWVKVRDRVRNNYGNKQRIDTTYNGLPKRRAQKRSDRTQAVKQAWSELDEQA